MTTNVKTVAFAALVVLVSVFIVSSLGEETDAQTYTYEGDGYVLYYTVASDKATITDFTSDSAFSGELTIPSQLGEYDVTAIGDHAFFEARLTSVTIPEGVTTLGLQSFAGSTITSVVLPGSLTTIGNSAFYYCNLTYLVIPENVTTIEPGALSYNPFEIVVIGGTLVDVTLGSENYSENVTVISLADQDSSVQGILTAFVSMYNKSHTQDLFLPEPDYEGLSQTYYFNVEEGQLSFNLNPVILNLIDDTKSGLSVEYSWVVDGTEQTNSTNAIAYENGKTYTMDLTMTCQGASTTVSIPYIDTAEGQNAVRFYDGQKLLSAQIVADNGNATAPAESPSHDGLTFSGWYLNGSGTEFNFSTPITEDIDLFAKYTVNDFEISLDAHYNDFTKVASFQANILNPVGEIEYTYSWTAEGSDTVLSTSQALTDPDMSRKYTVTVTASYILDGSATRNVPASTYQVTTDMPDGGLLKVHWGLVAGDPDVYILSANSSTVYLPTSGDDTYEIWYDLEGYVCERSDVTVTESGATVAFDSKLVAPTASPTIKPSNTGATLVVTPSHILDGVEYHLTCKLGSGTDTEEIVNASEEWEFPLTKTGSYTVTVTASLNGIQSLPYELTIEYTATSAGEEGTTVIEGEGTTTTVVTRPDGTSSETVESEKTTSNGTVESTVVENKDQNGSTTNGTIDVELKVINHNEGSEAKVDFDIGTIVGDRNTGVLDSTVTIDIMGDSAGAIVISQTTTESIIQAGAALTIVNDGMTLEMDTDTIGMLSKGEARISLVTSDHQDLNEDQIGSVPSDSSIIRIEASAGNAQIHDLGGIVSVSVPIPGHIPPSDAAVYYLDDYGGIHIMESSVNGDRIVFYTDHFSIFFVSTESLFADPPSYPDDDLPPFIPTQPAEDDSVTIVACAAAAVVAALMAVFLILTYRKD